VQKKYFKLAGGLQFSLLSGKQRTEVHFPINLQFTEIVEHLIFTGEK